MPIYTYLCEQCGYTEEQILKYEERDTEFKCPNCDADMHWQGVERPTLGKARYQMKAVTGDGQHVQGHFGKDARRERRGK